MARPRVHLAVSLALAAAQLWRTRRLLPALAPLLSGFLIDADHLLDHQLHRRAQPSPSERAGERALGRGQVILALHGWEYLLLLAWLERRPLGGRTAHGLLLGFLTHLAIDHLTNETEGPLTYFVSVRAARGFRAEAFTGQAGEHAWRESPVWQLWRWL